MVLKYTYRGYRTEFEYDMDDKIYYGSILNTKNKDIIIFHDTTIFGALRRFVDSVDDYIEFRAELDGKD